MSATLNVKCYRVNTLWHWRRSLPRGHYFKVDLHNLMELKEEMHETMLGMARSHEQHHEFLEAICVKAFYHTYGQQVKVVCGRKVPRGTVGECFWMGYKPYGYVRPRPEEVSKALRIGIRDAAGEVYWTTLNNVEVIPEVEHETSRPEYLYTFKRKFLDLPSLYGQEETEELKTIREELEKLHKEYAEQREVLEEANLQREKVEKQFLEDSPEIDAAFDEYEAIFTACSKLQEELENTTRKYFELWDKDIRPLAEISSKGAACRN